MIKYEDVAHISTEEYFNNNKFSIDAFNKKYALHDVETYVQALKRVCDYVASVELTEELRKYWSERWFDEIYDDYWHPAGSIMQGAASGKKISLANCTHLSLGGNDPNTEWDNLESIYKSGAYNVAKAAAFRQGLGMDFSRLRPRGSSVLNSSQKSTGAIHWMKEIDGIGYQVGQMGRIPAFLFSLNCTHPDLEEFIKCKENYTTVQNANISVQITNKFYEAVKKDEDWELSFETPEIKKGDKIYINQDAIDQDCIKDENGRWYKISLHHRPYEKISKIVKAKDILEMIAKGMFNYAEPGIQNIDIARKYSNSDYLYDPLDFKFDPRIIGTNACSEQYLDDGGNCNLSSINVYKFSVDPIEYKLQLKKIAYSINRFLDNVISCEVLYNTYALPKQKLSTLMLRRTGAGSTNWEGWLLKQSLEYGSEEANEAARKFNETYNYYLYESSINLGKEKGSFEYFDRKKFEKSPMVKHMIDLGLEFTHMRNITLSSIAPTGSLSLMFRGYVLSYGVEKSFGLYHWKRTRISGAYKYYFCVPRPVRDLFEEKGYKIDIKSDTIEDTWDGKFGKPIAEYIEKYKNEVFPNFKINVNPKKKMDFMSALMKDCDSSISVTYMLPEDSKWEDVYDFILYAYEKEVKSIAAFPDKKMYGIVSYIPFKQLAVNLLKEGKQIHYQNFSEKELEELDIQNESVAKTTSAPKRPKKLPADIYAVVVKGIKHVVAVGLYNNVPYEIFCGKSNNMDLKFREKTGHIEKIKRGHYNLILDDGTVYDSFSNHFEEVEKSLFRLVSTSLRHGVPIKFIVEQLNKSTDELGSLTAAAARVLKKYIDNGEVASGQTCPTCGSTDLIYEEGCITCSNCEWSKCS